LHMLATSITTTSFVDERQGDRGVREQQAPR